MLLLKKDFRCDLLSNFVLSNFDNNAALEETGQRSVVICFQTLFFLILITTVEQLKTLNRLL